MASLINHHLLNIRKTFFAMVLVLLFILPLYLWAQNVSPAKTEFDQLLTQMRNDSTLRTPGNYTILESYIAETEAGRAMSESERTQAQQAITQLRNPNQPYTNPTPQQTQPQQNLPISPTPQPSSPPQSSGPGQFEPLAGIPFFGGTSNLSLPQFVNAVYKLLIIVGALIAVIRITLAGFQYMGDNLGGKAEAKENIRSSLLGLLILLSTALILKTIWGEVSLTALELPRIATQQTPNATVPAGGSQSTGSIRPSAGCNQSAANRLQCNSGSVPAISGSSTSCTPSSQSNTTGFQPMTEEQCRAMTGNQVSPDAPGLMPFIGAIGSYFSSSGNAASIISNGGTIYGYTEQSPSGSPFNEERAQALQSACATASNNNPRARVTYSYNQQTGSVGFICHSPR